MPLYLIRSKAAELLVRANSPACARRVAVENAGAEGTSLWRDPEQSTVSLVEPEKGRIGLVIRKELQQ